MPADYSFATVNDYVHGMDAHFEDLQALCLGMATLRAQLAEIAASEPVGKVVSSGPANLPVFQWLSADHSLRCNIGDELFTRPMSADVTELVELLEFMWRDVPMNEYAFEKLEAALSKYKGAKL